MKLAIALLSVLIIASGCSTDSNPEAAKVRQTAKNYVDAFNRKDAKALTQLWAQDAILIHPDTGTSLEGSQAIENYFRTFLDQLGDAKIELKIKSITFPKENQAIEEGTSTLTQKGREPETSTYRAYYEKQDGEWRLVEVEEPIGDEDIDVAAENLKHLEWLIGNFVDDDKDYDVTTSSRWDEHHKFILQKFSISKNREHVIEGNQTIAWDPARQIIRSWIFDSAGGFGEGRWVKHGDDWIVETAFTMANGTHASSVNIYSNIQKDSYSWQSIGREIAGQFQPDIAQITVTRKK